MIDLFFKIQGMKPVFNFSNGFGKQIYAYLINECECCIAGPSHDFALVYQVDQFISTSNNPIRIDRISVNSNCKITDRNYPIEWHHNFWVKCSEYFAEKYLLEE